MHVDVNNAFLSWSAINMLKNGESIDIRNIPSVIGGDEERRSGIVLAKSPVAKKYGIKTGETLYSAKQKCPNIKVYPADFKIYKQSSESLYKLLLEYTDKIERFSIDECFLDMTNYLMGDTILNKALEINYRVKKELGFTVNVGVSENKLLAKMASDFEKPDKVHTLFKEEIQTKMWNLPVEELFMIGRKTVPKLNNMRINKIGDLAKYDINKLIKIFGKQGKLMWDYANGIDDSEVIYEYEQPKGVGNSITLPRDVSNIEDLEQVLLQLTQQVTFRLRKHELLANVVNVQLRTSEFIDFSHQRKLICSTSSTKEIYSLAKELLHEMYKSGTLIRLIGIRVDKLIGKNEKQISLFGEDKKQEKLDTVLDTIKSKYGYESIKRANGMYIDDKLKPKKSID